MALVHIDHHPTKRQLRQFGFLAWGLLPALVAWWWGLGAAFYIALALGTCVAALSWWRPSEARVIYLVACYLSYPIGWCFGWLALTGLFFALFVPMAILFRLIGRDRLKLSRREGAESYWEPSGRPEDVASYYRQS